MSVPVSPPSQFRPIFAPVSPDEVYAKLKARAAREGMSLSDFIKRELERTAERPSMLEWLGKTREAKPMQAKISSAMAVRELRD